MTRSKSFQRSFTWPTRLLKTSSASKRNRRSWYLFLKLDPKRSAGPKGLSRDVSQVGHYGTGDLEITITSQSDLDLAKPFIKKAYEAVGG